MKTRYALPLIPVVLSLIGCASPVPVAQTFPVSYQKVAQTARHWDVVAEDIVTQTVAAIDANPVLQKRSIFIPRAPGASAFDTSFRDFLINQMVNRGLPVSVCKTVPDQKAGFQMEGPEVEVSYEARIIRHKDELPQYRPGLLTAIAAGVAVLHNATAVSLSRGDANVGLIGLGAAADLGIGHLASATRTELVVTTTIAENNRFILRRSDIYYVPDGDADLFFKRVAQRSNCQGEAMMATAGHQAGDMESARREMFMRNMRRTNPAYKE